MLGDDIVIVLTALVLTLVQSGPVGSSPTGRLDYFECFTSALLGISRWDREGRLHAEKAEVAKYVQGYEGVASGRLVHVAKGQDDTGCSLPWPKVLLPTRDHSPWIALLRRGGCGFQTKIDNAQKSNASGVIVYNYRKTPQLSGPRVIRRMDSFPSDTIVAVFTYKWKGDELIQLLKESTNVNVYLSVANPCVQVDSIEDDDVVSSKLICVLFLALLVFFIFFSCIFLFAVQKYQSKTKPRHSSFYTQDERALAKIPKKTLTASDKIVNEEGECCAVCIDPYEAGDIVRSLTCGHEFHDSCIDPWLLEHRTCPMCKIDILKKFGSVFTGSQESILQVVEDEIPRRLSVVQVTIEEEVVEDDEEDEESLPVPVSSPEHAALTTSEVAVSLTEAPSPELEVDVDVVYTSDQSES